MAVRVRIRHPYTTNWHTFDLNALIAGEKVDVAVFSTEDQAKVHIDINNLVDDVRRIADDLSRGISINKGLELRDSAEAIYEAIKEVYDDETEEEDD